MKKRTLPEYKKGGNTPKKPKYSLKMNTERLASDNLNSYTKPHKYVDPANRPKEPLYEIATDTYLDQTQGGRGFNIGRQMGNFQKNPNFYSGAQLGLEFVKSATPVVGDLMANTGQVILQMGKDYQDNEYKKGGLIKRADGSYSKRGLWDNVRNNAGSGKKPTKEMLKQERKIKAKMEDGGTIDNPGFNALPKEVQDKIIANMAMGGYIYGEGGSIHIKPENKGKFTSWAKSHGMGVQEAASHVMANKEDYSSTIVKRANFAKNASKWKHQDGGTVKRSLNQYSQGGDMTGPIQLGSMVGTMAIDQLPNNQITDTEGNPVGNYEGMGKSVGKGAMKGAAIGATIGSAIPIVGTAVGGAAGAVIGGAAGFFKGREEEDEMKKMQAEANNNIMSRRRMGGLNSPITTMPTNVNNMYPYGGTIVNDQPGAIAELELQEQMQLPDGTVMGVDGPSHNNGGIEVNVPEGTRVFSDRLKNGKKTFAQHAKSINNKIAKLDEKPNTKAKMNTEMLFNKQLDNLFNTQEEMKVIKEETKQRKLFAKGGTIPPSHNGMYPAHNVRIMPDGGTVPSPFIKFGGYNTPQGYDYMVNKNIPKGSGIPQSELNMINAQREADLESLNSGFNVSPQQMGYATQALTNLMQNQQINKVKAPRSIAPVTFSAGRSPEYVDYSAERAAIDAETAAARRGVNLGSGSYSTQAANLQKIRNQQMMGKGRSFQTQENANKQLNNAYSAAQAAAYNQGVQANLGVDQYNLENLYNYNLWKAGNRMKATGSMGDNITNMINNQIARDNQMAYWNVMQNMYSGNVGKDIGMPDKKYGGVVKKRSLKK